MLVRPTRYESDDGRYVVSWHPLDNQWALGGEGCLRWLATPLWFRTAEEAVAVVDKLLVLDARATAIAAEVDEKYRPLTEEAERLAESLYGSDGLPPARLVADEGLLSPLEPRRWR